METVIGTLVGRWGEDTVPDVGQQFDVELDIDQVAAWSPGRTADQEGRNVWTEGVTNHLAASVEAIDDTVVSLRIADSVVMVERGKSFDGTHELGDVITLTVEADDLTLYPYTL